ncbi:MAG: pyrimidine 5'-nucleotidase [Roseiflexaceae bacterium]|nr:pyrimidine 5'-nucleotidase [Roseiflexus sp.]MDW8148962.1 pyrimidine 5'-nucleotidase [Roseiflexaceae bacterium]MDW8213970.1 pyrimidine 5'-nucleotidase [Roseiflexaceae bacterium]
MALTTILFDLDGTLYSRSTGVQHALDERMNVYVQQVTGCAPDEAPALRRSWFLRYGTTLAGLQHEYHIDVEDYLRVIHDIRLDTFLTRDRELDALLDQIDLRRAIFTNSPAEHAARVLRTLGVARHFPLIFDIRFFEFQPKPNRTSYTRALDALGVAASETLLIEDTPQNLPPARELGMRTILIDEQGAHSPDGIADYVAPDIRTALRVVMNGGAIS